MSKNSDLTVSIVDLINKPDERVEEIWIDRCISLLEEVADMDAVSFLLNFRQLESLESEQPFLASYPFPDMAPLPAGDMSTFALSMLKLSDDQRRLLFTAWSKMLRKKRDEQREHTS